MIDQFLFMQAVVYVRCVFLIVQAMRITLSNSGQLVQLSAKDSQSIPYWNILVLGVAISLRLSVLEERGYAPLISVIASSMLIVVVTVFSLYEKDVAKHGNRRDGWRTAAALLSFAFIMELCIGCTFHPNYLLVHI